MAEKYVKLDEVIDTIEHEWGYEGVREDLQKLPAADVVEVRHGYWYFTEYEYFSCSVCGKSHFNFCDSTAEARRKLADGEVYP